MRKSMLAGLIVLSFSAMASAQERYQEIDCAESLLSRAGMKCLKGPEFRDQSGIAQGNYYRITGPVNNVQGFATLMWPSSATVVTWKSDGEVKSELQDGFAAPKRDGNAWSDIKADGDLRFITFTMKDRSCAAYRKWGPAVTVTGRNGRPLNGSAFRMDGYFCLPPGETMTQDRVKQLVGEIKLKS